MAKKEEQAAAPVVSQIPVPQSDSPLVIDLPDGQKLVVGNLPTGTVIEVATWRGTGRPDSRTQRLMLGVSSSDSTAETAKSQGAAQSEENEVTTSEASGKSGRFDAILVPIFRVLFFVANLFLRANKQLRVAPSAPKKKSSPNVNSSVSKMKNDKSEFDPEDFAYQQSDESKKSKIKIPNFKTPSLKVSSFKNPAGKVSVENDIPNLSKNVANENLATENVDEWLDRIVAASNQKSRALSQSKKSTSSSTARAGIPAKKAKKSVSTSHSAKNRSATSGKKPVKKRSSKG